MKKRKNFKYTMISILSVLGFLLIWYLFADVIPNPKSTLLSSPFEVAKAFIVKFYNPNPEGGLMMQHVFASLKVALSGYLIGILIGVPLGICMAWYKGFEKFARPLFDLIRPVPGIAWIPVMIILFGIGLLSKAMIVFLSSFTACVVNSYSGIKQTKTVHLWVGETFGYSNSQMLFRIAIPTALPMIMTGLKGALSASWGALIAAELLAATAGLGFMIQQARGVIRPDIIIAGMLMIGLIGALLSGLLGLLEKLILKGGRW